MKGLLRLACLLSLPLLLVATASAQRPVSPPPQPVSGPSLAVTMQFIQDKLNGLGQANYAAYNHDNAGKDGDWVTHFSTIDTNVVADPSACKISYHEKRTKDDKVTSDADFWFLLSELQDVVIMPREQLLKRVNTRDGHPTWDARIDPPVYVLTARKDENTEWYFYIFDQDLANRVAKAMVHGIELCGGGNKSPF
ncbi:MAG: hypothetical protein ABSD72_12180 [Terracidiphilus sp.]